MQLAQNEVQSASNNNESHENSSIKMLMLGAMGVVFGDIGTSPLYALKECLKPFATHGVSAASVLGICSLIFWSIFLVISIKYIVFVMRADNNGEGGILSLMNLANLAAPSRVKATLLVLGLFGAATFYGDGIITPAISVLSAVEGMELISPGFKTYVLPVAFVIILALFYIQKHGTSHIGKLFGPVMMVWFVSIGLLGIYHITKNPHILYALNPLYAISFVADKTSLAFVIFGSVFLALTGGEALYADMGHFGKTPIARVWFYFVFPALALNYFGQGALILSNPKALDDPFYHMAPSWILIPLIIMATLATVIASQAVISGAFSMTKQAIQLGYIPRLNVVHTSENEIGQIYVPFVNTLLFVAVSVLLFTFKSSDALASAYGIAVVTTMIITTLLMGFVMRYKWNWNLYKLGSFLTVFLIMDSLFFGANALKIIDGGWVPLTFAGFIFFIMVTWKKGRSLVVENIRETTLDLNVFMPMIEKDENVTHTQGTAIFLSSVLGKTPVSFMHNLKHNHVLHERNIFLTMVTTEIPRVENKNKLKVTRLCDNAYQVQAFIGFKELPDVPELLILLQKELKDWNYNEMETSFFLSRESIQATPGSGMWMWRERFFGWMTKNSTKAADYFNIPYSRVVELGTQVCI